jgi:hypothetical protein
MKVVNKKHLALMSLIAAFSLLAFVFTTWTNPFNVHSVQRTSQSEQLSCAVPTSASFYLAEVKPRFAGFGAASVSSVLTPLALIQHQSVCSVERQQQAICNLPRPLWLLNCSLLI